ncbi:hypothetical protein C2R22_17020 [Salinigranum rubrum]|uniref:Uncharacterized protein n=1 Tax=Salinigranum rubrum TaxID=755307 RepID=A0A2I8VQ66_9EURY|nr:hypothetical protein [Salinigranum rubrum]AUV84036.1 hypothetical protein C2R22_17020 [Salinigranum rubrum]
MYEEAFGFDWKRLSEEEALKRMYALGVAAVLGERHPDEYTRIMRQASTAYRRSVLELSFKEGQQRAKNNRREFDGSQEVWDALVDTEGATPPPSPRDDVDDRKPKGSVPDAVTRAGLLEYDVDDLERVRLPKLLRRDS